MSNEIILTTSLNQFIITLLTVQGMREEYTLDCTADEQKRNAAHALQTKGLLALEQSGAKQYKLRFTETGLRYIRDNFDFNAGAATAAATEAATGSAEQVAEAPRRRGPLGRKLDGVLKMFSPLAAQKLTKVYKGRSLSVEIAEDGSCTVNNTYFTSLSKAAASVTGQSHINGRKFFGIKSTPAAV